MKEAQKLVGRWAVNGNGVLGKIEEVTTTPKVGVYLYTGRAIDDKPWQSRCPMVLEPQCQELLERRLEDAWHYLDLCK